MSTDNSQSNNSTNYERIIGLISIVCIVVVIVLVIVFKAIVTYVALVFGILGAFFTFLQVFPQVRNGVVQLIRSFPYKLLLRVFIIMSFVLNGILACIILWPSIFNSKFAPDRQPTSPHIVRSTPSSIQIQATATALYNQIMGGESPTINDALSSQDSLNWDDYTNQGNGSCTFQNGAYYSSATSGNTTSCLATNTNFSNLELQVQMTLIHGSSAGIVFRSDTQEDNFYTFYISTDGYFIMDKYYLSNGQYDTSTLSIGTNPVIQNVINRSFQLTVITKGTAFYFYVNKQYVDSVNNSSYPSGELGVDTIDNNSSLTEARFTNLFVWKM